MGVLVGDFRLLDNTGVPRDTNNKRRECEKRKGISDN